MQIVEMKHGLSLLLIGIFCFSCSKDVQDTQFDVEKDFSVEMRENLSEAGNTLLFFVQTLHNQDCTDTEIETDLRKNDRTVALSFLSIITPDDCTPGEAPATAAVDAGDLAVRDYEFKIDLRGEVESTGRLNVLSDRYVVSLNEELGFDFKQKELLRIPRYTIWGYVNHREEAEETAKSFTDDLRQVAEPLALPLGYYGWFRVTEVGISQVVGQPATDENLLFLLQFDGNEATLQFLLDEFRADYPDLTVALFDWEGKSF